MAALAAPLPAAWTDPVESRRVLDRHGGVLAVRAVPTRGRDLWVELDEVAPHVVDALIASEDRRFRGHLGVDPRAVARALWADVRAGAVVQGGSTLTQQTARLLAGRPPGLVGKVVEGWRALRLETHLSKDEILTWYLNRAYFGRGAWGVEAAARAWFDERAVGLSVAEAAALVALLPAPERLGPDTDTEEARRRRRAVVDAMVAMGTLSQADAARARAEPLQVRRRPSGGLAPHLSARLLAERSDDVEIPTTLDPELQRDVEHLVTEALVALRGREVDHAAVLVAEVATGDVLAWVGSGDFGADDGQVDGVRARRSSGSTLKPFLYGAAFEGGMRASEALPDIPRAWSTHHGVWRPENYGEDFQGPVRARVALACSSNVPAVAVVERLGVATAMQRLERAGFSLPESPAHYGLGLAIGGAEVSLEELVAAYAGLARGGVWQPLRVRSDRPPGETRWFLDGTAAWVVSDILADPVARIPAFGPRSPLTRRYPVAVKTGTSSGFRDNWTVGYTPDHVVGVWVGNFDGRAMGDVSGVTGAGPLWGRVMDRVTRAPRAFPPPPDGIVDDRYCALSGMPAGPHCPEVVQEWVMGAPSGHSCDWHLPTCEIAWPSVYRTWAADRGQLGGGEGCPTTGEIAIAWPRDGAALYVDPTLPLDRQAILLRPAAPVGARQAIWRVDGEVVPTSGPNDLDGRWLPTRGRHRISLTMDGVEARPIMIEVTGAP